MKWQEALNDFSLYLKIERGMSKNTVPNYNLDVQKLITYVKTYDMHISPLEITSIQIQEFIYNIAKSINPRSQSRLISGLRSFYDYLIFENYCESNPLERIEAPKIGRKLPDTLSVKDIDGEIIVVSQFTLHALTKKGNRPSYIKAAKPDIAIPMYEKFIQLLELELGKKIQTGQFGADMKVSLLNDGPVTIIVDTKNKE